MLRKTFLAIATIAAVGALAPSAAFAFGHGGGGGGHFGGGGGHFGGGGFHGGGFHRGFGVGAFGLGVGLGYGLYGPGYYGYGYPVYDDYYADETNCYVVRRHVHTRYGWRIRPVEVCR